jgi:hypothetical protein
VRGVHAAGVLASRRPVGTHLAASTNATPAAVHSWRRSMKPNQKKGDAAAIVTTNRINERASGEGLHHRGDPTHSHTYAGKMSP